jgi:hypothetical protein
LAFSQIRYENFVKAIHPSYPNESLSSANSIPEQTKLANLIKVLQMLPLANYETLEYLIKHLSKIASYAEHTGMTVKNLAIVWAPNLLRSRELETQGGIGALQCIAIQAVLTEYLIRFVDQLFIEQSRPLSFHRSNERLHSIDSESEVNSIEHDFSVQTITRTTRTDTGEEESPLTGRKHVTESNSNLRLITLKEARSRWERRRLIELQSTEQETSTIDQVSIARIDSSDRLAKSKFEEAKSMFESLEQEELKIVMRHPERFASKTSPDCTGSSPDRAFGVIGQFSSFRSKRNFGNLDLMSNESNDEQVHESGLIYSKSMDEKSIESCSPRSPTSESEFKSNLTDERKYATLEPNPTRYHTILNPKHFRKNKVNPNRFGQIQGQSNRNQSRED